MRLLVGFVLLLPLAAIAAPGPGGMTQAQLEDTIRELSSEHDGGNGVIHFVFNDVPMVCISDVAADRMRIVAPIIALEELEPQQLLYMLAANFHTTLDARYAMSDGVVHGVFIHPLSPISTTEIEAALRQVANVVLTFGQQYSSGELVFGAQ